MAKVGQALVQTISQNPSKSHSRGSRWAGTPSLGTAFSIRIPDQRVASDTAQNGRAAPFDVAHKRRLLLRGLRVTSVDERC